MLDIFRTLSAAARDIEGAEAVREAIVFAAWRRVAGELLSEHTAPLQLNASRFVVAVSSETWRKHLEDLSGQMLYKLNAAIGTPLVSYIEFCIDEDAVIEGRQRIDDDSEAAAEMRSTALEHISPELRSAAEKIADKELRAKFLLAAGSCLVRAQKRKN